MNYPLKDTGVHCCGLCWKKCLFCRTFNQSFNQKKSLQRFTVLLPFLYYYVIIIKGGELFSLPLHRKEVIQKTWNIFPSLSVNQ